MRLAMVCVVRYAVRDWLWIKWEDSCCACEFVEVVGVTPARRVLRSERLARLSNVYSIAGHTL